MCNCIYSKQDQAQCEFFRQTDNMWSVLMGCHLIVWSMMVNWFYETMRAIWEANEERSEDRERLIDGDVESGLFEERDEDIKGIHETSV